MLRAVVVFVGVCMLLKSSKKLVLFTRNNRQQVYCLPYWSIQCMVLFFFKRKKKKKKKKKKKRASQIILCI